MKIRELLKTILFAASLLLCLTLPATIFGADQFEEFDLSYTDEANLIKGDLITLPVRNMTRVSITDPDIADIVDASNDELLIVGKAVGNTALFIWDEDGKHTVMVYVINQNLDIVKNRIQNLFNTADIHEVKLTTNGQEGKVVVSGEVPDHKRDLFEQIIDQFNEDTINLVVDEKSEELIQIDMQITELNTTLSESLGIDWATGGVAGIAPTYKERDRTNKSDGHIRDFFQIGHFDRSGLLVAQVNALIIEGKGRILSKPKLVVISGEEASFLVGGEVPIRTTTFSDTGSSQENVEFKEFGINMTITPTIIKERIDIIMNLEVSELDASTASSISESVAFTTRSASTHLYLDDGQTIVLAGLIKHTENEAVTRIPFVSKLPIFGLLFRNTSNPVPDRDEELVIALTPHILTQKGNTRAGDVYKSNRQAASQQMLRSRKFSYQRPVPYYMGVPKEMTGYVHDVQQKISQAIFYPPEAQRYGWEGTVKVGMLILNDGTLAFALVKESSGRDIFDEVAVNTTKQLAPFTAFPSDTDLQELNVIIPIVYNLDNN